jgi:hypothetical protein
MSANSTSKFLTELIIRTGDYAYLIGQMIGYIKWLDYNYNITSEEKTKAIKKAQEFQDKFDAILHSQRREKEYVEVGNLEVPVDINPPTCTAKFKITNFHGLKRGCPLFVEAEGDKD